MSLTVYVCTYNIGNYSSITQYSLDQWSATFLMPIRTILVRGF